jgi:hypothetical protein
MDILGPYRTKIDNSRKHFLGVQVGALGIQTDTQHLSVFTHIVRYSYSICVQS